MHKKVLPTPTKSRTDIIRNKILIVAQCALDSKKEGIIVGECHVDDELPTVIAEEIFPALKNLVGDRQLCLQLEWKKSPKNLSLLSSFAASADPETAKNLVQRNMNSPFNLRKVRAAWRKVLSEALNQNFQIYMYDEVKISRVHLLKIRAREFGVPLAQVPLNIQAEVEQERIRISNPVMAENITNNAPKNSFSLIVTGLGHIKGKKGLHKLLDYPYVAFP